MDIVSLQSLADSLEPIADKHGLPNVIQALALVVSTKADRVEALNLPTLADKFNTVAASLINSAAVAEKLNL